ncbi:SDR family oxidoreductase [Nocardia terpenica]|uniref:NAD(P)H-binding protein n=1 Tax=Nocardia terpenica TaxID=455432 RepID=A0A6G9Z706_9NOCA|nr:NmrA family NAD(P)-binding protein [Nocardia terpenica]QIS20946.1 NAD(P)H-binding protein [Nocardia terpenica]
MTARILVTGGTGTLGRHVVPGLLAAGRELRVLSRSPRANVSGIDYVQGDLIKGEGIDAAVAGVDTIVHLAGDAKTDEVATRNLVDAAARAAVGHLVYIGVTAAERIPVAYFRAKVGAERAVEESGIPFTTLRAAQFHDLVSTMLQKVTKSPVVPVPGGLRLQPVEAAEVAQRLVELALGEPLGRVPDLAGPQVLEFGELLREYLRATGKRRLTVPIPFPGKAGRAYRNGDNLTFETEGTRTWADFLADRIGVAR